jgi:hypothetical protein
LPQDVANVHDQTHALNNLADTLSQHLFDVVKRVGFVSRAFSPEEPAVSALAS